MSNFEERFNKATTKEFLNNLKTDIERKRDELESLKEKVFNYFGKLEEDFEDKLVDIDDSAMEDMLIYDSLIDGIENILKYIESPEENLNNALEDLKKYIEKKHIDLH